MLLAHFNNISLEQLHLARLAVSGELPLMCPPGIAFARLKSFSARDMPLRGILPPCLWTLQQFALTNTEVGGTLPQVSPGANMQSLHLDSVRADTTLTGYRSLVQDCKRLRQLFVKRVIEFFSSIG